jgi:signal peptidase I
VRRGDIIVFKPPEALNSPDDFVKRVIGLPGEKVEIKDGLVYINDRALRKLFRESAPNYSFGPVIVPQGDLFVMGDNCNNIFDSHAWNAWLSEDRVVGKAFVVYWPVAHMGRLPRGLSFGGS